MVPIFRGHLYIYLFSAFLIVARFAFLASQTVYFRCVTMVSKKEDKVDFDKLEKELANAVEADQRYWRENDAKLRAVHQKVATYDEFRCDYCLVNALRLSKLVDDLQ